MANVVLPNSLREDLRTLGVVEGDVLLVHASFSSVGNVVGGPQALIEAFIHILTDTGTLVMPTHTAANTDPKNWRNPPAPEETWSQIRNTLPVFDRQKTPSLQMGILAETLRGWPGAVRSNHPIGSFCAVGARAEHVAVDAPLDAMCGEESPLQRVCALRGKVLLLGVGYDTCTMLHLAEHRSRAPFEMVSEGSAICVDGTRRWVSFDMRAYETEDFHECGRAYEKLGRHAKGRVGEAKAKLLDAADLVDFATTWMNETRS